MIAGIICAHNKPCQPQYIIGLYCKFHGHDKPEFNGLCLNLLYYVKIKKRIYEYSFMFLILVIKTIPTITSKDAFYF